jgi:hypothetical protein
VNRGTHNRGRARACAVLARWPQRISDPRIWVQEPFLTLLRSAIHAKLCEMRDRGGMEGKQYDVLTVQEDTLSARDESFIDRESVYDKELSLIYIVLPIPRFCAPGHGPLYFSSPLRFLHLARRRTRHRHLLLEVL